MAGVAKALAAKPKPQYAHIAEAVRAYVAREGISLAEVSRRLGATSDNLAHYWAAGTGGVSEKFRAPLAKLLGVPVNFLAPRYDGEAPDTSDIPEATEAQWATARLVKPALGPARRALALAEQAVAGEAPGVRVMAPAPALGGKLTYEGHGDGTATIAVRARLPLAQAKPLFRVLLDSGIDLVAENEDVGVGGRET